MIRNAGMGPPWFILGMYIIGIDTAPLLRILFICIILCRF